MEESDFRERWRATVSRWILDKLASRRNRRQQWEK
jgi:hypothetical protein